VRFEVLGPVTVLTCDGGPVRVPDRKVRALLADLLIHEGRAVGVERLIDDLWGDDLPANPASTLQTRVSQLRRALEDAEPGGRDLVVTQPPGYLLRVGPGQTDVGRFRELVTRARDTADAGGRAGLLAEALAIWRGPAFADVADEPYALAAVARLEEERLAALESWVEARVELGEHDILAAELAELVARYPLRERLRAAQMRALYRSGRHSEALDAFHDLRTRLDDDLGLDPGPEVTALHQAMLVRDPALTPGAAARSNLPAALTELVGRGEAVTGLRERLGRSRLITLTGPGGVGKTSLAIEAARSIAADYPDGVWLVELAPLPARAAPSEVASAVSEVLDGLLDVEGRQALLVLDNCEHVIDAAAAVADRMLRESPRLRVLATSREPLGIFGELTRPVPPLDLPDTDATPESAAASAAVRMFVARAADAAPDFSLTSANARQVVEICRRLDGLPLALELAATRVRALGVHDLAARLDDRFRVLATRRRGAPDRQQTLRAVIEWSWELLTGPERAVLRRLAPHTAACTLHAAEAVCSGDGVAGADVADLLARLVDRSLLVRLDTASGSRYRMLETVRAFGLEKLAEAGELETTEAGYAAYYGGLAQRSEPRLYGHGAAFARFGDIYRPAGPERSAIAEAASTVGSRDGTTIAYQQWGEGPAIILVANTMNDRRALTPLATRLAASFRVVAYDRRGRGGSGDTPPYAVAREVEDLAAVIDAVGGPVFAFGVTTGGVLAAEAAARGVELAGIAMIEPPFVLDGTRDRVPAGLAAQVEELVTAGRRGDAVELFLSVAVQMTPEVIAPMRSTPMWRDLETLAHTIPYDVTLMNGFGLPAHWAARVTQPTLVIAGGLSLEWRRRTARAVAELLPGGRLHVMEGHQSDPGPEVLAPIVEDFFLRR
jgi:predicted ATPase/DNA-binding SARP family transcriptional activator/pimeloyl-ACP methyl ester carboxylesterase